MWDWGRGRRETGKAGDGEGGRRERRVARGGGCYGQEEEKKENIFLDQSYITYSPISDEVLFMDLLILKPRIYFTNSSPQKNPGQVGEYKC